MLVPLNSRYTGHEVADVLRRTRAKALFVADGFLGRNQFDELRKAAAEDGGASPGPGLPALSAVVRILHRGAGDLDIAGVLAYAGLQEAAGGVCVRPRRRSAPGTASSGRTSQAR